jgi:hypothetical protein
MESVDQVPLLLVHVAELRVALNMPPAQEVSFAREDGNITRRDFDVLFYPCLTQSEGPFLGGVAEMVIGWRDGRPSPE